MGRFLDFDRIEGETDGMVNMTVWDRLTLPSRYHFLWA